MLDSNTQLKVLFYNGSTFTDYSQDMQDFTRDTNVVDFQTTHVWYVGFNKPIDKVYLDMNVVNNVSNILSIKYYNGSTYANVSGQIDSTKGFTRSGFISWDNDQTDQEQSTVDSDEMYWYQIVTDTNHLSTASYNAFNLIFSDDSELRIKVPTITNTSHLQGQPSHILQHVNARNFIIQELRNKNYGKRNDDGELQDINPWDILRIDQIKEAATYKALEFIYFNYSDSPGDKYELKSGKYRGHFERAFNLAKLAIDTDDDGIEDTSERETQSYTSRVIR